MADLFGFDNNQPSAAFSLINALSRVNIANNVRAAALARTSSARKPERNPNQARLDAQAREATRQVQAFSKLKTRQTNAVKTLEKATTKLGEMKALLLEARELIVRAGDTAVPEDQREFAARFDQLIGQINLKAKTAGRNNVNLIGGSARDVFDAQDLEVLTRPGSFNTTSYQGNFLAADYKITDLGGDLFLPNLFGSAVVQFPQPDPNDVGVLLKDDDTVVYDDSTGAVSLTRNGEGTAFLEGTLEKKGIGVLHAYFYDDFQDPTLRDTALADVSQALQTLRTNISLFEAKTTRAQVALEFTIGNIEENRDVVGRIEGEKFAAEQRFVLEQRKSDLLFQQAFNQSAGGGANNVLLLQQGSIFDFEA
jgi:flagellin-like hook-associated protein FlgL